MALPLGHWLGLNQDRGLHRGGEAAPACLQGQFPHRGFVLRVTA